MLIKPFFVTKGSEPDPPAQTRGAALAPLGTAPRRGGGAEFGGGLAPLILMRSRPRAPRGSPPPLPPLRNEQTPRKRRLSEAHG